MSCFSCQLFAQAEPQHATASCLVRFLAAFGTTMRAQLLKVQAGSSQAAFEQAGERLRAGKLVAFPTETVYGLGAHAARMLPPNKKRLPFLV